MSGEMALWAVRQDIKDPVAKLVLVALCEHCNEIGECYPNHETLTDYVRRSKPYIREKIRWLEAHGWLTRKTRREGDGRGRQTSNLYIIHEERGETRTAYKKRKIQEAAERAEKRSKTKSSGDAPQSPKSSVMPGKQGAVMAGKQGIAVMAGNHPRNNKEGNRSASGANKNLPRQAEPAAAAPPHTRDPRVGELMSNLAASLKMQNARQR